MPERLRRVLPLFGLFGVFYVGALVTLFFSRADRAVWPPTEAPVVLVIASVVFAIAGGVVVVVTGPHSVAERRRRWVADVMDGCTPEEATENLQA